MVNMIDWFVKRNNAHQLLDISSHPYHCKKGISYSQALRLKRIPSENAAVDKCCYDLEQWVLPGF